MTDNLPLPQIKNWKRLYEPGATVVCIKDNPPMTGFGHAIKVGDIVPVSGVCFADGRYVIAVDAECAFYALEGYFNVVEKEQTNLNNAICEVLNFTEETTLLQRGEAFEKLDRASKFLNEEDFGLRLEAVKETT